jgi:hypothetical protein
MTVAVRYWLTHYYAVSGEGLARGKSIVSMFVVEGSVWVGISRRESFGFFEKCRGSREEQHKKPESQASRSTGSEFRGSTGPCDL